MTKHLSFVFVLAIVPSIASAQEKSAYDIVVDKIITDELVSQSDIEKITDCGQLQLLMHWPLVRHGLEIKDPVLAKRFAYDLRYTPGILSDDDVVNLTTQNDKRTSLLAGLKFDVCSQKKQVAIPSVEAPASAAQPPIEPAVPAPAEPIESAVPPIEPAVPPPIEPATPAQPQPPVAPVAPQPPVAALPAPACPEPPQLECPAPASPPPPPPAPVQVCPVQNTDELKKSWQFDRLVEDVVYGSILLERRINQLPCAELRLLQLTVLARHGAMSEQGTDNDFFASQEWYSANPKMVGDTLKSALDVRDMVNLVRLRSASQRSCKP